MGYEPDDGEGDEHRDGEAVMVVTTHDRIPQDVIDEIVSSEGFIAGRAVHLS